MQNKEQTMRSKGKWPTEWEILQELRKSSILYCRYQSLNSDWKQKFMDFCTGRKTLPLTYDPFFKKIFHPDIHPDRLSRLLSSLLNRQVKVIRILPTEETLLEGGALLIMDILVELEDGSLANVEVQKIPYNFPGERMSCYSADLLLRQYNRVKGERGKDFKYNDIKKVYTIILYEKSTSEFHMIADQYVHIGKTIFDTGLSLELLQEYCLVALDVFREIPYPKDRCERNAWIGLLATENVEDAESLIADYPWLAEVYEEIAGYMCKPEEVLTMFSDALKILDNNTVQYMIEEQAQKLEEQLQQLDEQTQQLTEQALQLNKQALQLDEQTRQLDKQALQLDAQTRQLDEQTRQLDKQALQLDAQTRQLDEQAMQLDAQTRQLDAQAMQLDVQTKQLDAQAMQLDVQTKQLDAQAMQLDVQTKQLDAQAMQLDVQTKQLDAQAMQIQEKEHQLAEAEYKISISIYQDLGFTKDIVLQKIMTKYNISKELAEEKIAIYW